NLGRGLIFTGRHALPDELPAALRASPLRAPRRRRLRVPIDLPSGLLNRASVRALNAAIYRRPRAAAGLVPYDRFFYPLDAIEDWNRIYGRAGFVQFQCVVPAEDAGRGIGRMLDVVSGQGAGSFLAVLKRLGPGGGPLSFPMEGHTLALDIPASPAGVALHRRLVDIALAHGGRIYLAKDAAAPANALQAGYPEHAAFARERLETGAAGRFASAQSERLGL
ncbi:MAG TPA: FAD-binding protein, partial [Methylomirabilota bacterium]|nr:FAD-binding protein [Methylomirabilota bacterium]